jgi:hypothetical protein
MGEGEPRGACCNMTDMATPQAVEHDDGMDDAAIREQLRKFRATLTEPPPTMTPEDFESLLAGIDDSIAGRGIPHDEAMRSVGLDP